MSDGSSQHPVARGERPAADVQAIRDACISAQTRKKYTSNISGIKKWIREFLPQNESESDTARFFDEKGGLNLTEFTPAYFEKFLVHKRRTAKSVTLSGYRSAIKDLYRLEGIKLPVEYGDSMTQFFSGIKRLEADQNQSSTPKTSGKQPLTYSLYKTLCDASLVRNDSGFSHLFLTTQWNLMCRSVSVQTLQTQHLQIQDDSVGAIFFKTKTDQEGSGPRDPRHLYANPFSPSTCWITALGVYLACHPRLRPGALFPGSDQKVRFGKVLTSLLRDHRVGKSFGTHSIRKGVATFACGGSTGGPSIVSVCLRCGWSIGGVQDRYFRYEAAGDQFLGRVVAGLPVNDSKFAALPPHFDDHAEQTVKTTVKKMFPGLADESNLSEILELCLASLVLHADFLLETLPSNHDLLSTFVFTNPTALTELRGMLNNDESTRMHATGIPPHIELYRKLDMQQKSIDALPELLEERMEQVLEKKGVAAGNITRELLREEIRNMLSDAGLHQSNVNEQVDVRPSPARQYYTWGGKFHLLPEDFEFPSIDPLAAWMLWWFGDTRRGYPPYNGISSEDLNTPKKKATLSEWSMMMRHITSSIESELAAPMPSVRDEAHAIVLFKKGYGALKLKPSTRKRRADQIKLTTALRLVREVNITGSMPFKPRKRQKQKTQVDAFPASQQSSQHPSSSASPRRIASPGQEQREQCRDEVSRGHESLHDNQLRDYTRPPTFPRRPSEIRARTQTRTQEASVSVASGAGENQARRSSSRTSTAIYSNGEERGLSAGGHAPSTPR